MTARNDITGDAIASRGTTENYRNNYDAIFGKKKLPQLQEDIGPVKSAEVLYFEEEMALEEIRTRMRID